MLTGVRLPGGPDRGGMPSPPRGGAGVIMPATPGYGLTVAQGGSWRAAAVTASSTCGFGFQASLGTSRLRYSLQPEVPLFQRMPSSQRLLKELYKEEWLVSNC